MKASPTSKTRTAEPRRTAWWYCIIKSGNLLEGRGCPFWYAMELHTNHGDKQMDRRKDTAVEAVLEQLIETGPADIASVFARAFELAMQIERERFLGGGQEFAIVLSSCSKALAMRSIWLVV
jgi:hypothetical protein